MSIKFGKRVLSFAAAAVVLCSATTAYAQEAVGSVAAAEGLTIESCAENIKNVYKARYPEQADMIEDIVDTIAVNGEFIYAFQHEGATAFKIVEDSLMDALEPEASPYAWTDELYYTSHLVPTVKQINDGFCGPASTVMALIGSGAPGYYYTTDESITNGWQNDVAGSMPQTGGYGAYVWEITDVMNANIPAKDGYSYKSIYTSKKYNTYSKVLSEIEGSLMDDAVPIVQFPSTRWFNYYGGSHYMHYMPVIAVDIVAEEITVVDSNYLEGGKFLGKHYISFDEFETMFNNSGEIFIIAHTADESNSYIYQ